ncbi:hypothetical protein MC885_011154, partial [Smutsia gigantea]
EGKTQGPACLRVGMFNTAMGKLQQQLQNGEYDIFKSVTMFESDFFQITKQGELVDMHKNVRITTVGIVNTNPLYLIPDIMLLAQPVPRCKLHAGCGQATKGKGHKDTTTLELTRLFPLKLVKISILDRDKHQLHLKLATGRSYYLQLCAPPDEQEDLFASWEGIIDLLRSQVQDYSRTHAVPAGTCFSKRTGGAPKQHISKEQKIRDREEVTAEEPVAKAMTRGAEGVAVGSTAGAFSRTVTKSASEQLSTALAGAATECPGGTKTNTATSGAANMCPEGIKMSLEGATNKAPECTSSVSAILSLEDSVRMATAGAAPASKMGGEAMKGTGVLASPTSTPTLRREQAGRQLRLSPASPEAHEGRRERREDGVLRSSLPRRVADSCHKAGEDKIPHKPGDRTLGGQRAPREKEEGRRSSGRGKHVTFREEVSPAHTPTAEASRASHKLGGTKSSGSSRKIHSSIGSLLSNVKARLSGRTKPQRGGHSGEDLHGDHPKE